MRKMFIALLGASIHIFGCDAVITTNQSSGTVSASSSGSDGGFGGYAIDGGNLGGGGSNQGGMGGAGGSIPERDCFCRDLLDGELCGDSIAHELHEELDQCFCFVPTYPEGSECDICQENECVNYTYNYTCNMCFITGPCEGPFVNCILDGQF